MGAVFLKTIEYVNIVVSYVITVIDFVINSFLAITILLFVLKKTVQLFIRACSYISSIFFPTHII